MVQGILAGLRPAVIAMIASAGISLLIMALYGQRTLPNDLASLDLIAAIIFVLAFCLRSGNRIRFGLWQVRDLQESSCMHLYKRGGAVMKYTIKAGVLYKNESQLALARIKSVLLGPQRKILSIAGELLLTADVRYLDESKASSGDVRNREYLLTDNENQLVGSARPRICRW